MERDVIIKAAELLTAKEFISILEVENVNFDILDQDDIMNANSGYCNIEVEGLLEGESILFVDGKCSRF
jgi:hypothetical protein